jgi:membrane protein DedA with SNARE-associated domain
VTHALLSLVETLGYAVVFLGVGIESLGIPVPGETVLVVGAALAGQGHLEAWGVGLAAWAGAVIGDNIGYWIGRRYGRRLSGAPVLRHIYTERRIRAADRFFERWGWLAVFFGRFVALLRIFAGPLAGMHGTPWRAFLAANAAGGLVWVAVMTTIGVLLGANLDHAVHLVEQLGSGGLAVAGALVVLAVILHLYRRRRAQAGEAGGGD